MKKRTILIPIVVLAATMLAACSSSTGYEYVAPASVEEVSDDLWRVTLTPAAAERTGIELGEVSSGVFDGTEMSTIPYSAVMYHYDGTEWTYTGEGLTYMRLPIEIERIENGTAFLRSGPPLGTAVVTVGAAELYGVEFGIGK